jgi:hypothetical protein
MAVVAVTGPEVEVLPAEPVDELAGLAARCSALEVEDEGLWGRSRGCCGRTSGCGR